jgi:hypothetical protein
VSFLRWHGRALKYARAREGKLGCPGEDGNGLEWDLAAGTERGPTGRLPSIVGRTNDAGRRGT